MSSATLALKSYVIAAHPTAKGFGWILFENPATPLDWGMVFAKPGRQAQLLKRFRRIADRYQPAVLVLEEINGRKCERALRIQSVAKALERLAQALGMHVPIFGRDVVQHYFARHGATTRFEIAEVIARHIPALARKLPRKRRIWESENPRQSIFDAAALALTFYAVQGEFD